LEPRQVCPPFAPNKFPHRALFDSFNVADELGAEDARVETRRVDEAGRLDDGSSLEETMPAQVPKDVLQPEYGHYDMTRVITSTLTFPAICGTASAPSIPARPISRKA
jgi:hypothetical protein